MNDFRFVTAMDSIRFVSFVRVDYRVVVVVSVVICGGGDDGA